MEDFIRGIRKIRTVSESKPTIEGAGVHLRRAFGYYQVPQFDPFLLLDDFRSDDPAASASAATVPLSFMQTASTCRLA
jgi:redox-sensitive bicupin YhaK (pirin superfamily)